MDANYGLPIFEYSWLNKSKSKEYPILRRQGLSRLSRRCILQQPFRLLRVWSPHITLASMFLDRRRKLPRGRGLLLVHAVDVGVQQLGGGAPGLHHHRHHPLVGGHLLFNPCLRQVITSIFLFLINNKPFSHQIRVPCKSCSSKSGDKHNPRHRCSCPCESFQ